ncbi:pentatricopeptide repeat-containing protein At2g36980, mitochondrial [Dendrobium catenatum]|uniref:Pentatricopeptide repeat-containing protein n=1 Tax=Dendrobium catenatum TaxID=906689 RepID=A0A2I0X760_9ASPA|nr:pentatricopeptide repeat-containing protein At2g36980, mitochondrial [Dendrobium catenatum]PKU83730.1 Pentatricopeptide repeat-containing protein [Dendrobium catenatum]
MCRLHVISTTSRIVILARSGLLSAAQQLFDQMPDKDTVAWNAMLAAYSRAGLPSQALSLFYTMRASYTPTDPFSFTSALAAAADLRHIRAGEKLHSLALRSGFCISLPVSNSLINMYGRCFRPLNANKVFEEIDEGNEVSWCSLLHGLVMSGLLEEASKVFEDMPIRNLIAWNIMIMGFASSDCPEISICLFRKMVMLGFKGDVLTFTSLINSCAELSEPFFGQMIHSMIIQNGWASTVEVSNSLLSYYTKFSCHIDASRIFKSMETRSLVSWNTMIDAHMKLGNIEEALKLFQAAPETNIVSWTSIVAGFARNGYGEEALYYFVNMQRNLHLPDQFTLGAVLHACATLTVLGNGLMVHGCSICHGFEPFVYVSNGLVNMYAKCGDIKSSSKVFDEMKAKDLVSCNAMIFGFAVHGWAQKALNLLEYMIASSVLPDKLTFLGLLMACCHSGLVEQGMNVLSCMESVHGVSPDADHLTCVVDVLSRAGCLKQATILLDLIEEKHVGYCEALLSGSSVHGDVRLGKKVGEKLIGMEPEKDVGYVMLSNLYCFNGRWKDAEKMRKAMGEQGVKKAPGCSWIEVRDVLMVFVSGVASLSHMVDLHNMLTVLESEMRNPSFVSFGLRS